MPCTALITPQAAKAAAIACRVLPPLVVRSAVIRSTLLQRLRLNTDHLCPVLLWGCVIMRDTSTPRWRTWLMLLALSSFAILGKPLVTLAPEGTEWWSDLRNAAISVALLLGAHLIHAIAKDHWGRRGKRSRPVPKVALDLLCLGLYALAGLIGISLLFHQDLSGILTGSGLVLAMLGFAIRNVVADIFSGLALGIEASFRIGDWVMIEGLATGRVQEIGWRTTRLVTRDSTYVILPNSQISRQRVTNFSAPRKEYRDHVELTLPVEVPVTDAAAEIRLAVLEARVIVQSKGAEVQVAHYSPQGITYRVKYWVPQHDQEMACRNEVISLIDARLRAAKVSLSPVTNLPPAGLPPSLA